MLIKGKLKHLYLDRDKEAELYWHLVDSVKNGTDLATALEQSHASAEDVEHFRQLIGMSLDNPDVA